MDERDWLMLVQQARCLFFSRGRKKREARRDLKSKFIRIGIKARFSLMDKGLRRKAS